MCRIKNLILLCIVLTIFNCKAQKKETIYIVFDENSSETCEYSPYRDGRDKKTVPSKHKKLYLGSKVVFKICNATFEKKSKTSENEIINNNIYKDLNIIDMSSLYEIEEKNFPKRSRNENFENIYILEKIDNEKYRKHAVEWVELFINEN